MLTISNLTKKFGSKTILNNICLTVQPGEIVVLLGQSGVGKSTLLRVLNNLESIDSGTIAINGTNLDLKTIQQRHLVGMVFQQFNLFDHLTVEQNITVPLEQVLKKTPDQARALAHTLLAHYGLEGHAHKYPNQLSGGQKQRLALARTLALKPTIICLDEPTSALDPLLTTHIAHTIQELAKQGYMILVATHDTALLDKLPCMIYLMRDGSIVERVSSSDFARDKAAYSDLAHFVAGTMR
ncbi:MAG: amino acid ABC transporter ATP-binding protein [Candidatus Babeliales bacterium]